MDIGARIYYDKTTGEIIQNTGERSGDVVETTIEHDFEVYKSLQERVFNTVGMLQLEYKEKEQDFREGKLSKVDPITKELLFSYPDPQVPGEVTSPQPALSVQVDQLKIQNTELMLAVAELASANETDKIETQLAIAELAAIVTGGVA